MLHYYSKWIGGNYINRKIFSFNYLIAIKFFEVPEKNFRITKTCTTAVQRITIVSIDESISMLLAFLICERISRTDFNFFNANAEEAIVSLKRLIDS